MLLLIKTICKMYLKFPSLDLVGVFFHLSVEKCPININSFTLKLM